MHATPALSLSHTRTHSVYMTDLGTWWTPAPSTQVQKGKVSAVYLFIPLISIANPSDLSQCSSPQCIEPMLSNLNLTSFTIPFKCNFLYRCWWIIQFLFDWISNEQVIFYGWVARNVTSLQISRPCRILGVILFIESVVQDSPFLPWSFLSPDWSSLGLVSLIQRSA